jgi:protein-L-isoaspartate(D-aspartate) O-methyltransferase
MSDDSDQATRRRNVLTDKLKGEGLIRSLSVEAAFRAVPRHLFVPQAALWRAYADEALPLKKEGDTWLSSISQPAMVAIMLEQLDLRAGQRILEIGAGAGYNAALMAHIVGADGRVVTLDIDEDIIQRAQAHLAAAGVTNVTALTADGALGHPGGAPYDRIILTVAATDIAPAWREQLKPGGRLVLPIDFADKRAQFSIAFDEADGVLIGRSFEPCGFIRLRGAMAAPPPAASATIPARPETLRPLSLGEMIAASIGQLLPKVSREMWRRRMNREVFGRPSLEGLVLRAYPIEASYVPAERETHYDRPATRFVVAWGD